MQHLVAGASSVRRPRVDLERGWATVRATANPGVVVAADICRWLDGNHGLGAADWWCRGEDKRDKSACSTATYQGGRSPAGVDQGAGHGSRRQPTTRPGRLFSTIHALEDSRGAPIMPPNFQARPGQGCDDAGSRPNGVLPGIPASASAYAGVGRTAALLFCVCSCLSYPCSALVCLWAPCCFSLACLAVSTTQNIEFSALWLDPSLLVSKHFVIVLLSSSFCGSLSVCLSCSLVV